MLLWIPNIRIFIDAPLDGEISIIDNPIIPKSIISGSIDFIEEIDETTKPPLEGEIKYVD